MHSVKLNVIGRLATFSGLVLKTYLTLKFDRKAFSFDKLGYILKMFRVMPTLQ